MSYQIKCLFNIVFIPEFELVQIQNKFYSNTMTLLQNYQELDTEEEKYEYLIELGDSLKKLNSSQKIQENRIIGCQNRVWLVVEEIDSKVIIFGESDSRLVSGLIAIVIDMYSNLTRQEISKISQNWSNQKPLNLSMTRQNGLNSIILKIQKFSQN
jgi:cysteine desulfuration protein SufE